MELVIVSDTDYATQSPPPSLSAVPVKRLPFTVDRATAVQLLFATEMGAFTSEQLA